MTRIHYHSGKKYSQFGEKFQAFYHFLQKNHSFTLQRTLRLEVEMFFRTHFAPQELLLNLIWINICIKYR